MIRSLVMWIERSSEEWLNWMAPMAYQAALLVIAVWLICACARRASPRSGKPVAGATVSVERWRQAQARIATFRTDGEGRFEWSWAPSDRVTFLIRCLGYKRMGLTLGPRPEPHRVTLEPVPTKENDGGAPPDPRRPGYDPFKIFRRLSDAGRGAKNAASGVG